MNNDHHPFHLSNFQPRKFRRVFLILGTFISLAIFLKLIFGSTKLRESILHEAVGEEEKKIYIPKAFVVASRENDDTKWIGENFGDWKIVRYVVDNSTEVEYSVPMNKGREAMVYLTYIIDHYDELPDLVVFMHAGRYQWHNDDPLYDGIPMLKALQLPYILEQGYVNLRCVWTLGCPDELRFTGTSDPSRTTEIAFPLAFSELFPGKKLPETIGVACCAQFAATRNTIRIASLEEYKNYRTWLLNTNLTDYISGRVLEYSWHMIFGKEAVFCPDAKECYCRVFGLCGLGCEEEGKCGERWPFPPSNELPEGWPEVGWDREVRDRETLERMREVGMPENSTGGL